MKAQDISKVFQYKNSTTAIFLGSGPSINDISKEEWVRIETFDMWTVNNWIYHPTVVPDFYHLELKAYNFPVVKNRMEEKKEQYKNVKFIIPKDKFLTLSDGRRVMTKDAIPKTHPFVFVYNWLDYKPTEKKDIRVDYKIDPNFIHRSYGISFPSVLELMYKFGYKKIILCGVDLSNSYYFWTGRPECGKVHHQTNKAHEKKDPRLPHNTIRVKSFIVDFNKKFMQRNNREIFVGTKKSALYPNLRFKSIGEL